MRHLIHIHIYKCEYNFSLVLSKKYIYKHNYFILIIIHFYENNFQKRVKRI